MLNHVTVIIQELQQPPNAAWDGYFNTYQSVLANASATTHPIFHAVQNLSITVDGTVFDDWYIPAHNEAEFVYQNLKLTTSWQDSSQGFEQITGTTQGELWTSTGDSCSNTGVLVTAGKFWAASIYCWSKSIWILQR